MVATTTVPKATGSSSEVFNHAGRLYPRVPGIADEAMIKICDFMRDTTEKPLRDEIAINRRTLLEMRTQRDDAERRASDLIRKNDEYMAALAEITVERMRQEHRLQEQHENLTRLRYRIDALEQQNPQALK